MQKNVKILLISPPLTGSLSVGISIIKAPLGLAYIAAYLEKQEYHPEIIDCMAYYEEIEKKEDGNYRVGLSEKKIIRKIKNFNPDIVGISCSFSVYEKDSIQVAKLVKQNSDALVIFGGAHSSANPDSVLKNKCVDVVVKGEGEVVFSDIVKNFRNKKKINSIPGTIIRKNNGGIKVNKSAEYIKNLDEIPFPARHLLPMERYLKHPHNSIANMRGPTTEIITSRGCPFNCIFCSIHTVWGKKWRARSPKNVVDELESLYKEYNIREFRFFDDNISWDKKRMIEICNEIIKRKLDIKWDTPNGVALVTLDEEVLKKMKKAGYYKTIICIESGCEKTLKFIRKPLTLDLAKKIIKTCNKLGIWTWSAFIIGFPDETKEDIQKTIDFAKRSGLNFVTFYVAQPYPGTEMYDVFKEKGLIKGELVGGIMEGSSLVDTKYDTIHFSARELRDLRKKAFSDFIKYRIILYLNPIKFYREFLNRIRSLEDLFFILKMVKNLVNREYDPAYNKDKYNPIDKKEEKSSIFKMPHRNNLLRKIEMNIRILFLNDRKWEKNMLKKICVGRGADIGCGSEKVCENSIGVDIIPGGKRGSYGNQKGKISKADICASGDNLPSFKDNELDYIVAKHNLEHYEDPKKTLIEWRRVLKNGGKIGVTVPNNKFVNSLKLDPTHYVSFNLDSLEKLFEKVGFKIIEKGDAIKNWSIYMIAEK